VIDLRTGTLAATTDADWTPVREANHGLWELMTRERDRIRLCQETREEQHDA
jgi:hypothetical protein